MIDLHTHTDASDGTLAPAALVDAALAQRLEALAITDHDTLDGYDRAAPVARAAGLDLVCGVELSTRMDSGGGGGGSRNIHLLGYFLRTAGPPGLRDWLEEMLEHRRDRNRRLAARLQSLGLDIRLEEAEALGHTATGRPHFASLMVRKGYAANLREAFDRYLGETAPGYVERKEPSTRRAIAAVLAAGGVPVLAHPVRMGARDQAGEQAILARLVEAGLAGLEVFHPDHSPADVERFRGYAARFSLEETGGSDFHGAAKPGVTLGCVAVPRALLERLRERWG